MVIPVYVEVIKSWDSLSVIGVNLSTKPFTSPYTKGVRLKTELEIPDEVEEMPRKKKEVPPAASASKTCTCYVEDYRDAHLLPEPGETCLVCKGVRK